MITKRVVYERQRHDAEIRYAKYDPHAAAADLSFGPLRIRRYVLLWDCVLRELLREQ